VWPTMMTPSSSTTIGWRKPNSRIDVATASMPASFAQACQHPAALEERGWIVASQQRRQGIIGHFAELVLVALDGGRGRRSSRRTGDRCWTVRWRCRQGACWRLAGQDLAFIRQGIVVRFGFPSRPALGPPIRQGWVVMVTLWGTDGLFELLPATPLAAVVEAQGRHLAVRILHDTGVMMSMR